MPILIDIAVLLSFKSHDEQKNKIHLVRYEDNDNDADGDEWAGKIKHLSKIITDTNKLIEKNLNERLALVQRDIVNKMHDEIE